ncbi:hypothetical protein B1A_02088, partial [mine drainage metagenome]
GMRSWKEGERTFYEISGPEVEQWQINQGVYQSVEQGIEGIVRRIENGGPVIELLRDHRNERHGIWGSRRATASRTSR